MSDNRHGEIILHQNEDGSVQLRDNLSRFWCACGGAAVHRDFTELPPHDFKCIKCIGKDRAVVSKVFVLYRKKKNQTEWLRTLKGDANLIAEALRLNLLSGDLKDFEWKVGESSE
ncbi:MAG TPA: hypothetical protein IAA29_11915 [Candidatus Paenibacillus intestinavium]|nr:hypothetical protein [Candidatus Paenibacillus intestinavium]